MSYTITIVYQDEYGDNDYCEITGENYLMYDDPMREPIEVRRILKYGHVTGRLTEDGWISRSGKIIPAHMIKVIRWDDTLSEDEKRKERSNE